MDIKDAGLTLGCLETFLAQFIPKNYIYILAVQMNSLQKVSNIKISFLIFLKKLSFLCEIIKKILNYR